jgi:site-specific recombinase XerD
MKNIISPLPLFDTIDYFADQNDFSYLNNQYHLEDIHITIAFLKSYNGSRGTFDSYRREVERLLHWCALVVNKTLKELKREHLEAYIKFCQDPPQSWIGKSKPTKFKIINGERVPNPLWRPFIVTVSKIDRVHGKKPRINQFELSNDSMKELFAILSSFYTYLLQDEYVDINPIALVRQRSKFIRKRQGKPKVRRLSELQWQYVIKTAQDLADAAPNTHERTLFILSALYSMYLRISELTATDRWIPIMNHFYKDNEGHWWFTTVGKGNKERQIAVSHAMLKALKRWRKHLGLPSLPSPADNTPLLPKSNGSAIKSTNLIRNIVQFCFNKAVEQLNRDGFFDDAESLPAATVHWLRHTGISDDVKIRPREHVRDDAGHGSSAITDQYIDIELRARHESARKKPISD